MKNSRIEYFTPKMENITLKTLEKRLIESCIKQNNTANNFKFEFDIKGDFIFCLLTCDIKNKYFPTMWRMLSVNAYDASENIFYDGNLGGDYTIEDVKNRTVNYLTHTLNNVKEVLETI